MCSSFNLSHLICWKGCTSLCNKLCFHSSDAVFTITLNGKDALTEDQNSLESCGIISGDLIVLRVPDSELVAAAASSTAQPTLDQRQPAVSNIESVQPSKSHCDQRGDWTSVTQSLPEVGGMARCTCTERMWGLPMMDPIPLF